MSSDTIFALASGRGRSGVAVVRLSGSDARASLAALTRKPLPESHHAVVRDIVSVDKNTVIDQSLVIFFAEPNSFTGEDVVELHLHGGPAILTAVFDQLANLPELRPAGRSGNSTW